MVNAVLGRESVAATEDEQAQLVELEQLLAACSFLLFVPGPDTRVQIPPVALALLRRLVHLLAQGKVVTLTLSDRLLTTQQAADILNVSRPYLVRILERGDIPFSTTGTHRRVRFEDVLAYKRERDARQLTALQELAEMSQALGLYGSSDIVAS